MTLLFSKHKTKTIFSSKQFPRLKGQEGGPYPQALPLIRACLECPQSKVGRGRRVRKMRKDHQGRRGGEEGTARVPPGGKTPFQTKLAFIKDNGL